MWADKSVFYQIYPLGFCGTPRENDGVPASRIGKIGDWAEEAGLETEYILCSGDPDSLDAVILPTKGVAVVDGTAPQGIVS